MLVKNMTGQRFGRLLIIARDGSSASGKARWLCRCDCGEELTVAGSNLRTGQQSSCGCFRREFTTGKNYKHGFAAIDARPSEYNIWKSMIARCHSPNSHAYKDYGARGIAVCQKWRESFTAFFQDVGPRPTDLTLDRIDNDGGYEPGNVQWATRKQQAQNQRRAGPAT